MSFLAQTVLSTLITARKVVIIRIIMSELAIQVCIAICAFVQIAAWQQLLLAFFVN